MAELGRTLDPKGSPVEKLVVARERLLEPIVLRDYSAGTVRLDPDTLEAVGGALRGYDKRKTWQLSRHVDEVETWANRHTHEIDLLGISAPLVLTVEATDVEVPSGSDGPIMFGAVPVRSQIVEWDTAGSEIVWPLGGTVFFYVEGAWDDLDPGETFAEVLVDGVAVWNCWINSSPTGITVTLEAASVSIPTATPTIIEFTVEARNQDVNVALPSSQVIWPVAGVVQGYVHGRWDVLDNPAQFEFELLVDDVAVWPDL